MFTLLRKKYQILGLLCTFLFLYCALVPVKGQGTGVAVKAGDTITYSGSASASYRMYQNGIKLVITNADKYPVRGNLTINNGKESPMTNEGDLIPYIAKVPSEWLVGSTNSPFYGYVESDSVLITNWTFENLDIGETAIYADSERNTTKLTVHYQMTSQGDLYNISMVYRWDMQFGIILEYRCNITNLDDFALDGFFTLSLSETSLWKLETGGIAGYPVESVIFSFVIISGIIVFSIRKKLKVAGISGGL